ncbi:DUF4190 domain-containing protein [Streptomyces sp. NPDC002328]|uniref:DUF4190 domain-containing protein n=1 Tax=Streptomyces sp. NPDC002328 TaxID=3364642 RepID=UPI0036B897A2
MSDDAPATAAPKEAAGSRSDSADDAVHDPWAAPGSVPAGAEGPQYAVGQTTADEGDAPEDAVPAARVPLTKGDTETLIKRDTETLAKGDGGAPADPAPWPEAPAEPDGDSDGTVVFPDPPLTQVPSAPTAPAPEDHEPPSVHHQQTVTSLPGTSIPGTSLPGAAPTVQAAFAGFPPPDPATLAGGPAPGADPFAPPAHGAVPPPPIAPDGPGQVPYGQPGYGQVGYGYPGGYGHPGAPVGYGGGAPAYYGWNGMRPPSNGMGLAAMVLGILSAAGICMWPTPLFIGPLAVIFGFIGRSKAKRGEANNAAQALAGIICGIAGFLMAAALLVFVIWAPLSSS